MQMIANITVMLGNNRYDWFQPN